MLANDTINESSPRTITPGSELALDTIFNGLVSTSNLLDEFGEGTYRVAVSFRDEEGDPLYGISGGALEASWQFLITDS